MSATDISVVIPTRNASTYLPALFESLRYSKVRADEYVFCDGESTDGTSELIRDFARTFPARVLSAPPRGVYDAWNRGIAAASGKWIYLVCADDWVAPATLSMLRERIRFCPEDVGLVGWSIDLIDEQGVVTESLASTGILGAVSRELVGREHIRSAALEAALIHCFRGYFISFMAHAFRKEVWEQRPFSTDRGPSADIEWTYRAHLRGWRKWHIPQTLAAWRVQSQSITSRFPPQERIAAHSELRAAYLAEFASLLKLTPAQTREWAQLCPALDAYDWFAAWRSARTFRAAVQAGRGLLQSAGCTGVGALALTKLGVAGRRAYRRPVNQFWEIFGERWRSEVEWRDAF